MLLFAHGRATWPAGLSPSPWLWLCCLCFSPLLRFAGPASCEGRAFIANNRVEVTRLHFPFSLTYMSDTKTKSAPPAERKEKFTTLSGLHIHRMYNENNLSN